jgi:hypothetical protein
MMYNVLGTALILREGSVLMIRSVEIKNFRGIQDGKLEDLTPLVILVGPNGCGKSTILDALLIGANPVPGEAIDQLDKERIKINRGGRWLIWRTNQSGSAEINVATDRTGGRRTVHLDLISGAESHFEVQFSIVGSDRDSDETSTLGSIRDNGSSYSNQPYPLVGVEQIRLVEVGSKSLQPPLHELFTKAVEQGRHKEARGTLADVISGATNVEILTDNDTPILHVVYNDYSVPLTLAGDGIESLAHLSLEPASCSGGVVLLEEPEVHQHPGAILQSAKAILAAVRRDIQVILSTHSLDLIDALLSEVQSDAELDKLSLYGLTEPNIDR